MNAADHAREADATLARLSSDDSSIFALMATAHALTALALSQTGADLIDPAPPGPPPVPLLLSAPTSTALHDDLRDAIIEAANHEGLGRSVALLLAHTATPKVVAVIERHALVTDS